MQQGVLNVAYMGQGAKEVQQKGTRVEKIEKNFKKTSERKKLERDEQIWFKRRCTCATCQGRGRRVRTCEERVRRV